MQRLKTGRQPAPLLPRSAPTDLEQLAGLELGNGGQGPDQALPQQLEGQGDCARRCGAGRGRRRRRQLERPSQAAFLPPQAQKAGGMQPCGRCRATHLCTLPRACFRWPATHRRQLLRLPGRRQPRWPGLTIDDDLLVLALGGLQVLGAAEAQPASKVDEAQGGQLRARAKGRRSRPGCWQADAGGERPRQWKSARKRHIVPAGGQLRLPRADNMIFSSKHHRGEEA